jgi:hypothetical protein
MSGLQQACDKIIQDITSVQQSCDGGYIATQLNNLIDIAKSMSIGQRLSDISALQTVYDNIYSGQATYINLIKDLQGIQQYANAFTSGGTHDAFCKIFGGTLDDQTKVLGFISYVQNGGVESPSSTNFIYSINNVFADYSMPNPLNPKQTLYYVSAFNQIINGCDSSVHPLDNHY